MMMMMMIKRTIKKKTYQDTDRFNFCLTFTDFITSTHRLVLSNLAFLHISLSLMDLPLSDHRQHFQTEASGILMILIFRLDTNLK